MLTITAAEFQRHFGRYQDEALTQPVTITRNGRARLVVISADEYQRLAGVGDSEKNLAKGARAAGAGQ